MSENLYDIYLLEFQHAAQNCIHRNKNLLDSLSKHENAASHISRAIIKASTQCGCIFLCGKKEEIPTTQISGEICPDCREIIENEIGEELFYLAAIASAFDISLYDILLRERKKLEILGKFSLK